MSRNSPVTLAGPKQVEVPALDREFESLWKSLAPDNEEATEDDRAFTDPASITSELSRVYVLPASDVAVLSSLAADAILGTESASFMIRSVAQFRAMTLEIQGVVEKSGNVQFFSGGIPQRIRAPLKSGPGGEEEPAFKLLSS